MKSPVKVAVYPQNWRSERISAEVTAAGADLVDSQEASALIWTDHRPEQISSVLTDRIDWIHLPFAGVEDFFDVFDTRRVWTCGKGVYARPVAEHTLTSMLMMLRGFAGYSAATEWTKPVGRNLDECHVAIVGAGGIATELLALLAPFRCFTTVIRRTNARLAGADATVSVTALDAVLAEADVVVLALASTPESRGMLDSSRFSMMKKDSVVVNVARGSVIVTDHLVSALENGEIGGAVLDVTDPEPLPVGHRLWDLPNCVITPHIGNTPEMGLALLCERVRTNVERYAAGLPLLGPVDIQAGY